jgi:hypothetical protein
MPTDDTPPVQKRRPRYLGKNPRTFHEKYKELNPERYEADVRKIVESGKTPAGMHRAIMVAEVLQALAPRAGGVAVDCTLGFGGHARAVLDRIQLSLEFPCLESANRKIRLDSNQQPLRPRRDYMIVVSWPTVVLLSLSFPPEAVRGRGGGADRITPE